MGTELKEGLECRDDIKEKNEDSNLQHDAALLFDTVRLGNSILVIGDSQEILNFFINAVKHGIRGIFIWIDNGNNQSPPLHMPHWLRDPRYNRGPFVMNYEILYCKPDEIQISTLIGPHRWMSCVIRSRPQNKNSNKKKRRSSIVVPLKKEETTDSIRTFHQDDGWFVLASQNYPKMESSCISYCHSIMDRYITNYGVEIYKYFPMPLSNKRSLLVASIVGVFLYIPRFFLTSMNSFWATTYQGLVTVFSSMRYVDLWWRCWAVFGHTEFPRYHKMIRIVVVCIYFVSHPILASIPIYRGDNLFYLSPDIIVLTTIFIMQNTLTGIGLLFGKEIVKHKISWTNFVFGFTLLLFASFPPVIFLAILLEEVSPTLSGIFISNVFMALELIMVALTEYRYENDVYKHIPTHQLTDRLLSPLPPGPHSGEQKTAALFCIICSHVWCETARLITMICTLITSTKRTGIEDPTSFLISIFTSVLLRILVRCGFSELILVPLTVRYWSKESAFKFFVPSLWTWLHRDVNYYYGYVRFFCIIPLLIVRGFIVPTGFTLYTNHTESFCWTPGVLYCILAALLAEIIEDTTVFTLMKPGSYLSQWHGKLSKELVSERSSDIFSARTTHIIDPKGNVKYSPTFIGCISEKSFINEYFYFAPTVLLVPVLFTLFLGKSSYIGTGEVQIVPENLYKNAIELILSE